MEVGVLVLCSGVVARWWCCGFGWDLGRQLESAFCMGRLPCFLG